MEQEWITGSDGYNQKFKRETLLNYAMNRWGLNKAHSVGPTSELIRSCAPSKYEEWEEFYFTQAIQKKKGGLPVTKAYLTYLGQELYIKLTESVRNELSQITEDECIDYVYNLVISRTWEGYQTEIDTIYGQLEGAVGWKIKAAPDEWDRSFNVDFFIKVKDKYIGIQIKPISSGQALNQYQWVEMHRKNHERFERTFGGRVYFVYSTKGSSGKKMIHNPEVVEQIKTEIIRLQSA